MSRDWKADNLKANYLKDQLDDLERDFKSITKQLRGETNRTTQNQLKIQVEQLGEQMNEIEQQLRQHRLAAAQRATQVAQFELISILDRHRETQFDLMMQAYLQTISQWPKLANTQVADVQTLVTELSKIPKGDEPYSARTEFIANLVHLSSVPDLALQLNAWGNLYQSGISWLELHKQIERKQQEISLNIQPAILISFILSEEASTQSVEENPLYKLRAWLIEDIGTYKSQSVGCVSLLKDSGSDVAPCAIEALLANMPALLNTLLEEKNCRYPKCINPPEIHVFLPLELMHVATDMWQLNKPGARRAEYLGHDRVVMVRCSNRYRASYTHNVTWRRHWQRLLQMSQKLARDVFVPGHDEDLDELLELIEDAISPDDSTIVGLQMTRAPTNLEGMCEELLDAGIPLAIWPRKNLSEEAHYAQLSCLLSESCLSAFPNAVQRKRREARLPRNSVDLHIGHHLSLLWDDPELVPPKSNRVA